MDIFGFDNKEGIENQSGMPGAPEPEKKPDIPGNLDFTANKLIIDATLRGYKRSTTGLIIVIALVLILLNLIIVPYYFNQILEERISELELDAASLRNLPENYTMAGVEVGLAAIDTAVEINCSSATESSAGSGFIINSDGYIITNAHVVTYDKRVGYFTTETAVYTSITCNFYKDDTLYSLDVIYYDLNADLALLRFDDVPAGIKAVTFGNSDHLVMGEEVVAIGNAEGLGLALTVGVVSDPLKEFTDGVNAIQTDAAINPGNSGGPLFSVYAELIGVTTFKIIDTDANEGMGFAIPSNEVIDFISDAASSEHITVNITLSEDYYI